MKYAATILIAALAVALAACGGGQKSAADQKAADDARTTEMALAMTDVLTAFCGPPNMTRGSGEKGAAGVRTIIRIATEHPDFIYDGRTMTQVLADESRDTEACSPVLAHQFDAARLAMP